MSKTRTAPRWSWTAWLTRLAVTPLTDEVRAVGRDFVVASRRLGRLRRWLAAYQVDGAWGPGNMVLTGLHRLRLQNLLLYRDGHFYPVLGPPVPRAGAYVLNRHELVLLDFLLRRCGGRGLYHCNDGASGYFGYWGEHGQPRWHAQPQVANSTQPASRIVVPAVVRGLFRRGLIAPNGCGHGWPVQHTSEYRVVTQRLYAVRNLPARLQRYRRDEW